MNAERKNEQQQLRPYRFVVAGFLTINFCLLLGFVLNGIVKHLDRMPSVDQFAQPQSVDNRALKACTIDLQKLEVRIRKEAARLFESPNPVTGEPIWQNLEKARLEIMARCKLTTPDSHPAHASLVNATEQIESQIRAFNLLYAKHLKESSDYSGVAQKELEEALKAIKQGQRSP